MDGQELAQRLTDIASTLVGGDESPKRTNERQASRGRVATRNRIARDFHTACALGREIKKAGPSPRVNIIALPGIEEGDLKEQIDRVVMVRHEITRLTLQYEAVLKTLAGLTAEEKKGIEKLKMAAKQMREKGRYLVEAEDAILEFTAYLGSARPGLRQLLGEPSKNERGGALMERIALRLGKQIADAVQEIYENTYEDLTETPDAIRGLKVVAKTASVRTAALKRAGIADIVVGVKEWLAGEVSALSKRALGIAVKITTWVAGFIERTKLVKSGLGKLSTAIKSGQDELDALIESV